MKKVAFFVTGNVHKFNEARKVLAEYGGATAMLNLEAVEIQDDSLENIAKTSAVDAARKSSLPVFVEDAGLFVKALNGFPGPYSSYVYRTVGNRGILKLMQMEDMSRTSHGMISKALLLTHGVGLQKCFGFAETKILSPL